MIISVFHLIVIFSYDAMSVSVIFIWGGVVYKLSVFLLLNVYYDIANPNSEVSQVCFVRLFCLLLFYLFIYLFASDIKYIQVGTWSIVNMIKI